MAIDHVIDYDCIPKQTFTTDGILERLKGEDRAHTIIALFREHGDDRSPGEMGFEFTRSTPDGEEERRIVVVQDLLDAAAELDTVSQHCVGCPANRTGNRFGCMGFIQYPISAEGEKWLIDRLPVPDEPLIWLLLKQGVDEFKYDGSTVSPLRASGDTYFKSPNTILRRLGEIKIDSDQVFEMLFAVGNIQPNHGALLLLFLHAIPRDLEAQEIMTITPAPDDAFLRHPFTIKQEASFDQTITEFKDFLHALYLAWALNVRLLVDA